MMTTISFFTPVVFVKDAFLTNVDGYFSYGSKRAVVVPFERDDMSYEVKIGNYPRSIFLTALKVLSLVSLVIPLIMLFAKIMLRAKYSFKLVNINDVKGKQPKIELTNSNEKKQNGEITNGNEKKPEQLKKDIFVFGDVHGTLEGFKENLRKAKIIDDNDNWIGGTAIVVQVGDVLDRGPKPKEAFDYLSELQKKALKNDGQVIRLLGDHELMFIQKKYDYAYPMKNEDCEELTDKILKDIKDKNIILSWTDGQRIYSHAGIRYSLRKQLKNEISEKQKKGKKQITYSDMTKEMNDILINAVNSNKFDHNLFKIREIRGGNGEGGPLGEDFDQLTLSQKANKIPQVVGHTPPLNNPSDSIRIRGNLICVDAGLAAYYGGQNAFIQIQGKSIFVYKKINDIWKKIEHNQNLDV